MRPVGSRDLALQLGIPPDVVGVDHHSHRRGVEALGQVERLRQRDHHRALGDHHRVKRLDAQADTVLGGVGEERLDALQHLAPRRLQVAVRRRTAHQHQHVGAQLRRLLDGDAVVLRALGLCGAAVGREEAAATEAGHAQAALADARRGIRHELVPPGPEPADLSSRAGLNGRLETQVVGGDLVEAEPGRVEPHGSTPPTASRRRMRSEANGGSASRPAASASRKTSARCTSVRAPSSPATIRKWL